MRSSPFVREQVVREQIVRVGTYADEARRRQWLRVVEIAVGDRRRCRVDLTVGVPAAWSLSIDGFASLDEAVRYVEGSTQRVSWSEPAAPAVAAAGTADRLIAWYVGEQRHPARALEVDLADVVDGGAIEVEVELDDFEPTGRAA